MIVFLINVYSRTTIRQSEASSNPTSQDRSVNENPSPPAADMMKSRIESWIKGGEQDAVIAEHYLDKKKERKQLRSASKTSIGTRLLELIYYLLK